MIIDEILKFGAAVHRRAIAFHHVARAQAFEFFSDSGLRRGAVCRVEQEPTDESEPQRAETRAVEEAEEAERNETEGRDLTCVYGDAGCASGVACRPPDYGPQHTPAIEREPRNQIEYSQSNVDIP